MRCVTEAEIRLALPPGLSHVPLPGGDHRRSAVLVLLEAERGVWLTRRAADLPNHAGQVAFPGGKIEPSDVSADAAALREAQEEIGLRDGDAEVLGRMDDIITGTGFHIAPVVALLRPGGSFKANPREVQDIFCLPFATLLDVTEPRRRRASFGGGEREFWVWPHDQFLIWGATAEILLQLARRCARQVLDRLLNSPGVAALWDVLPEARIAGGAVRDALAGRPIADVDFASPLTPAAVITRLAAARIKTVPTGLAHGTVTAVLGGRGFEITTLRRDLVTDGRHAVVSFTDDWEADASRRDFTINAMSAARDGGVFDYFDGRADLAAGRVRFVGDADARITEDYLRILRFFRFFGRYGQANPDPDALAAITRRGAGLRQLSVERVWSELKFLLLADDPAPAVRLMQMTGVLAIVLPHAEIGRFEALLARRAPVDPVLRIAALSGEDAADFSARLKLSGEEQEKLTALRRPNALTPAADDATLRRALAEEAPGMLGLRTWLTPGDWSDLRRRIAATPRPVFPLQGRDLTSLGIAPGPEIGRMLNRAYEWWLRGGCVADAKACLKQIGLG